MTPDILSASWAMGMYDPMKRHQIEVLRSAGFSLREVARRAEVSLDTVQRVLRGDLGSDPTLRRVGRPPLAVPFEETARAILAEVGDLPTVEVLRRLREMGYSGGKNPVYQMVRRLRHVVTPPIVRFEGFAGESLEADHRRSHDLTELSGQTVDRVLSARVPALPEVPQKLDRREVRALFEQLTGDTLVAERHRRPAHGLRQMRLDGLPSEHPTNRVPFHSRFLGDLTQGEPRIVQDAYRVAFHLVVQLAPSSMGSRIDGGVEGAHGRTPSSDGGVGE